jgi:hypothetical protein
VWKAKLNDTLLSFGFSRCPSEPAIYTKMINDSQLVVGVYVDDLVVTGASLDGIRMFKAEMAKVFNMSDLGLRHYYLGIEVRQSADGIFLNQGAYERKILDKSGMEGCNSYQSPMEPRLKLSKQSSKLAVDKTSYRSIVGSLRYLVNTHPDIAHSVGYVSRFLEEPCEDHLGAVKHILRYIAGTCDWGIWFGRRTEEEAALTGFSDSNYAGDVDKRHSTTGVIFLGSNLISWQSMNQKVVAQSSCEAEYIATSNATC